MANPVHRKGIRDGFSELCRRETGSCRPTSFSRRFSASEVLVEKLNLYAKLNGHEGCVNAVEFNSTGDVLVSGSDDKQVVIWDWASKTKRLSYNSGHLDNIFQTKIMPFTDDRKIVTSSSDGQVRLGQILDNGHVDTKKLGKHQGRVYKLAVEPGSPHILYSCGEDGFVQHFDLRTTSATKLFYCCYISENTKLPPNSIRLNSIVIDPRNPNYFAIGGSDEYARLYDIRKCRWDASNNFDSPVNTFCPQHLIEADNVHITGLAYSGTSELLVTYNDELIYLFQKNMGLGPSPLRASRQDLMKLAEPRVFKGHRNSQTVKGVNFFGPHDEYVLSGSDCGHIFIWRKKGAKLMRVMLGDRHIVNHLEPHPYMPVIASCGIEKSVKLWAPLTSDDTPLPGNVDEIMESNRQGREDQSRVNLTPDVIMHVLRMQRRQTLSYMERRYSRADIDSNQDPSVLGFSHAHAHASPQEGSRTGDCTIN